MAAAETRRTILLSVKEQARLLQEALGDPSSSTGARWSPQQWWQSFTFLFVDGGAAGGGAGHAHQQQQQQQQQQDDLLFFVRRQQQQPSAPAAAAAAPVFVRRKGKQLPDDLQLSGALFTGVDWPQTMLLNLVLHSQYQLTVVACGRETLPFVAEGRAWGAGTITVAKPVFASTSVTAVNLDSSRAKESTPQPCYPDVCFAVDNFDDAFEDLVLEDASRCYCVVLHALLEAHEPSAGSSPPDAAGAAARASSQQQGGRGGGGSGGSWPGDTHQQQQQQKQQQQQPPPSAVGAAGDGAAAAPRAQHADAPGAAPLPGRHSSADEGSSLHSWRIGSARKRTLFAGYVSYEQIATFLEGSGPAGRRLLEALVSKGSGAHTQRDRVVMTGPNGVGRCEVAVTKLVQQQQQQQEGGAGGVAGAAQPQQQQQQQRGLLQRAWQAAAGVQQALDALSAVRPGASSGPCSMLCALMTLRLPVGFLAQELLEAV